MRWIPWVVLVSSGASAAELGAPLLLTSGWQAVLEVPELKGVSIDDATVASVCEVHGDSITLQGLVPGETRLWAWSGKRALYFPVVVTHFPTVLPFEHILPLKVDERFTLSIAKATHVLVADRSVVAAKIDLGAVELVGRRAGTTTLIAWVEGHPRYLLISVRGGTVTPSSDELDEELTEPVDGRVVLRVGERGVFDSPVGLARFALKDDSVARVQPRPGELVFEGTHVGATRVLFWTRAGAPTSSRYVVVLPRAGGDPDPVPEPPASEPPPLPVESMP